MNYKLFDNLFKEREKLKIKYYAGGRTPTICSDESLREMARLMPRTRSELQAIRGLGNAFYEKYGDFFLAEINRFLNAGKRAVLLRKEVRKTLKRLEDRLVNISHRNRLLYMGRIIKKNAFDLFWDGWDRYNEVIPKFIMGEEKALRIADVSFSRDFAAANERRFKSATTLIREARLASRETGEDDMFIAYPFVMGKTIAEDFNVRAPLLLFPVSISATLENITLRLDKTRDILFNTNLVLLQNKVTGTRSDADPVYDETQKYDFAGNIVKYYTEQGIRISGGLNGFGKFREYAAAEFPQFNRGEFVFDDCAVLGRFSMYSSAMQRDFRALGESREISVLLDQLLSGLGEENQHIQKEEDIDAVPEPEAANVFNEHEVNYINELNASQENAIVKIRGGETLVIHGPPGTGKSQVITSFISDFAASGKNVLMVSQKKTALDVIYSRLGKLSSYALFVSDVKNKEDFYKQLNNLFFSNANNRFDATMFTALSEHIEGNLGRLAFIEEKLFEESPLGVPMVRVYQENVDNIFRAGLPETEITRMVKIAEKYGLAKIPYTRFASIYNSFKDSSRMTAALAHHRIVSSYPWMEALHEEISKFDKGKMQEDFAVFVETQTAYLEANIFKRFFTRGRQMRLLKKTAKKYFSKFNYTAMFKNPQNIAQSFEQIESLVETRFLYKGLASDERNYLAALNKTDTVNANKHLYDFIIYMTVEKFESANRGVFDNIKSYDYIIKKVSSDIAAKAEITREKLHRALLDAHHEYIAISKRYGDMKRISESKRKWAIPKFIERFSLELLKGVKVWLMTPEVISEVLPLQSDLFDLLIFDEASQIYIERGVPAVARAKKVIVAGDSKQLRPSSLGVGKIDSFDDEAEIDYEEENTALEVESLLDLAKTQFSENEVMLNYHYRSQYEELIAFSNAAFYNGRLMVSPNFEVPALPPIQVITVKDGRWIDRTNKHEAVQVIKLIRAHLEGREKKETIGVITFNSNQRDMIMDYLDAECKADPDFAQAVAKETDRKDNGEDTGFFIKNIENVQGDERDVIIFSFAYAKDSGGKVVRNYGWLNQSGGENRLNVAISRAKKKIIIVTSVEPYELIVDDLKNNGPKLLRKYLEYARAVDARNTEAAERVLSTLCEKQILPAESTQAFEENIISEIQNVLPKNYILERNVGMGNYEIDIAIKENSTGSYVLGIEIDSKLYEQLKNERERDIHRSTYLTARGWKIHRIYSSNWFTDKQSELSKILAALGN